MNSKLAGQSTLLLGSALVAATAFVLLADWAAHRPSAAHRLVHGKVLKRDFTWVGPLRRPVVTVEVQGESSTVHAVLMVDSVRAIPDEVRFYIPPATGGEVQLLEETSSLVAALLAFTLSATGLALVIATRKR